ncbi:MAG: exonuclease domain-containing protein [bacterium]
MNNIDIIDIPISEAEFSVLDFETTGISARFDRVIEIGLVKVKNLKIVDTYQSFINPGRKIPPFITNLTGIKDSDVEGAPMFIDIVEQILEFIGDSILTAHNMPFDDSFLKSELEYAGYDDFYNSRLCTLKLARKLYPELKSKSLPNLVQHFHIRNKNAHRAIGDATCTARILLKMIDEVKENHNIERVSDLLGFQSASLFAPRFSFIKKKLIEDFSTLPDTPGVYFF